MTDRKYTYETFSFSGKSINCYGLEVVKNSVGSKNIEFLPFDKYSKNTVLFSLYWPEQILDLIKFRYSSFMKDRHIIIGGNTATANPSVLLGLDNVSVFLGDGENFNPDGEFLIDRESGKTKKSVARSISPIIYEDIQNNRVTFCEMSRGCKNKCLFCQYGWLKDYRESSVLDIEEVIKRAKTKSIRMFAADRFQHRRYPDIRNALKKYGKNDTGSDVSIRFLLRNKAYLSLTNKVRVGIEGMSYRLRRLIGKRFSDDDIVEFCMSVADAGIKTMDWYMIYGLPTEADSDIDAFKCLIARLDDCLPEGYTICIHWNAFTPSAQTPFESESSSLCRSTQYLEREIFKTRANNRIKLYHKPKLTSETTLAFRCIAIRSDKNCIGLLNHIKKNKSDFLRRPDAYVKKFESITGFDPRGRVDSEKLPWIKYVEYKKEIMQRVYRTSMERHGK